MPISLDKAAYLLGTSKEMLRRWAKQGVVPTIEKAGIYRFDKRLLVAWAKRRGMSLRTEPPAREDNNAVSPISLDRAMETGGCYFDVDGFDVESVFRNAVEQVDWPEDIPQSELVERLLEREGLASTGVGNGIAVPHPRYPFEQSPEGGMICTFFLKNEIDFMAVDGKPVSVMFLMLNRNTKTHLQLLARLSFCLHQPTFLELLSKCRDESTFLNWVRQMECGLGGNNPPQGV